MADKHNYTFLKDPMCLIRVLWPHIKLWSREEELVYSMWHNRHTICVAGNMLGKDFTTALGVLGFFLTRPVCRIVTTSVDGTQLSAVLWGEIRNLLNTSRVPLESTAGGPIVVNDLHLRKVFTSGPQKGQMCGLSYVLGRVAAKGEGMLGHHLAEERAYDDPKTMFVGDEASGLDQINIERAETWADRIVLIGNAYQCTNYFFTGSEAGDVLSDRKVKDVRGVTLGEPTKTIPQYDVKVIRVPCSESPNVIYGEMEVARGMEASGKMLVPGVMSYWKYKDRRKRWDKVKQCIQLDARFYKGAELLLFPPEWLSASAHLESSLGSNTLYRTARAIGCDPGEGEAETAWYVIDDRGILEEVAYQTPDTSVIAKQTVALLRKWNVPPEMTMFDRGGGGKQVADQLRDQGYHVRTVAFGESVAPDPKRGMTSVENRIEEKEEAYAYFNRRAEMYDLLSQFINPSLPEEGQGPRFCIPNRYTELHRQLAPIPKPYDKEGRLKLPPKNKSNPDSKEKTLVEIIGCSPDRADALVVALYCREYSTTRYRAGAA